MHRPLIRASLPRPEGQPPPTRPTPDFTIRQPGGRPNRFRPRHQRAAASSSRGIGRMATWAGGRCAAVRQQNSTVTPRRPASRAGPQTIQVARHVDDQSRRQTRPHRRCGQQAVDLVGHRAGRCCSRRSARPHLSERAARRERARARRQARQCGRAALRRVERRATSARSLQALEREFGGLDFLVHGAAFAPAEALSSPFVETSRDSFRIALDVSAYSLVGLTRAVMPLMERRGGGSVLTLTYLGSQRVFTNYNVMGVAKAALEASVRYLASDLGPKNIRVNAISAGADQDARRRRHFGFFEHSPGLSRPGAAAP